jgi:hypothetical protein
MRYQAYCLELEMRHIVYASLRKLGSALLHGSVGSQLPAPISSTSITALQMMKAANAFLDTPQSKPAPASAAEVAHIEAQLRGDDIVPATTPLSSTTSALEAWRAGRDAVNGFRYFRA